MGLDTTPWVYPYSMSPTGAFTLGQIVFKLKTSFCELVGADGRTRVLHEPGDAFTKRVDGYGLESVITYKGRSTPVFVINANGTWTRFIAPELVASIDHNARPHIARIKQHYLQRQT